MFTFLLTISALLVAGIAAYFSVLGIATLFSGSYQEVIIMAASLEIGKLVATTYLHRYWTATNKLLKTYLCIAVFVLMGITSIGIFGYLSAAYQSNSLNFAQITSNIETLEQQKQNFDNEIEQNKSRIDTLNKSRISQEQRLPGLSTKSAQPIYKDIEKAGEEIQSLTQRTATLQDSKTEKDNQILALKQEIAKAKDIGTFKFVAQAIEKPLDTVVTMFICILIGVFDPLAVALILALNVALKKEDEIDYSFLTELEKSHQTSEVAEPELEESTSSIDEEQTETKNSKPNTKKIKLGIVSGTVKG